VTSAPPPSPPKDEAASSSARTALETGSGVHNRPPPVQAARIRGSAKARGKNNNKKTHNFPTTRPQRQTPAPDSFKPSHTHAHSLHKRIFKTAHMLSLRVSPESRRGFSWHRVKFLLQKKKAKQPKQCGAAQGCCGWAPARWVRDGGRVVCRF